MTLPRSEYPRPQFVRTDWLCLNGEWQFEKDGGDSGLARGLRDRELTQTITVPFCLESSLSGIGDPDFVAAVWYRREVAVPSEWSGKRILLHFQAVDYDTTIWVNGEQVGRHRGGFTPITCSLGKLAGQTVTIVVRARDDKQSAKPRGKQAGHYAPAGCHYTRTTGIWQTVWMEPVADISFLRPRITPDVAHGCFELTLPLSAGGPGASQPGLRVRATLKDTQGVVTTAEARADGDFSPHLTLAIPEERRRLWSISDPHLYDITLELIDSTGSVLDRVESYAGLRSVTLDGKAIKINGETIFQRLVLDQGYYPDGVLTAPSDIALKADIQMSMDAGFNGARLHQKVFEERFLYHADKMGYIVWGEFPDWGCSGYGPYHDHQQPGVTYVTQFLEVLERDYSHPSVVGWCPLNETHQPLTDQITNLDDATRGMFLACKAMDQTRPVLDSSGYAHRVSETDIYDSHDYEQDPKKFAETHSSVADDKPYINKADHNQAESLPYRGQPYFVSEFGGIWWNPAAKEGDQSWGYGERVKSLEAWYTRFEGLFNVLLDDPSMFGYCYTQLTDVYPEENGLYTFDRKPKFDIPRLHAVQQRPAAIETAKENK